MGKKNKGHGGLVYSTNSDAFDDYNDEQSEETRPKNQQKLRVRIETKHRGGKTVTAVDGFIGSEEDMKDLGKELKTKCGAGGSVKDGLIIIQGDYKEKIIGWLRDWGYTLTK
ncbi:MAG: translation initiation factor [Chitinophagales bacterium]|nr:translation initiation factor [Chitinophagaceae bacterium]MCB9063894.1 translation initiation factor [Chitinophagales bacterium]